MDRDQQIAPIKEKNEDICVLIRVLDPYTFFTHPDPAFKMNTDVDLAHGQYFYQNNYFLALSSFWLCLIFNKIT